jgi:enoyl-CoA hydratase/carnithine racemase
MMATDEATVRVEQRGGCAWVTLDRPPLNLLTRRLIGELRAAFVALSQDESVRVVVVAGAGRAMTGGMQLQELRDLDQTSARAFIAELAAAIDAVYRAPFPTIAMIHGACLGAGLELVMACDLRVATPDARLGLPEVRVGIPSVIHAALLPSLVGPGRAAELLLTGEPIDGQRALEWGLVNRLAPGDALRATTEGLIDAILACGPRAIRLQKELLVGWRNVPLEAAIAASVEVFARAYATDEPRRAMEAFLARRPL